MNRRQFLKLGLGTLTAAALKLKPVMPTVINPVIQHLQDLQLYIQRLADDVGYLPEWTIMMSPEMYRALKDYFPTQ